MPSLPVVSRIDELRSLLDERRASGRRIGVVPTMGALHAGHVSLLRAARESCDVVVATIFVNPTQFAPGEDFEKYPRPFERDLDLCAGAGTDLVFAPDAATMYPPGSQTVVSVPELARPWEGARRPTHFAGVTTVVLKLLNLVQPHVAFFGQKDYQQQLLIRRMCRDLDVRTRIETCATVREPDGLALSSRNVYLSAEERRAALVLSRALRTATELAAAETGRLGAAREAMRALAAAEPLATLEYATIVDAWTLQELDAPGDAMVALIAARVGATRLIDNVLLPPFDLDKLNSG